MLNRLLIILCFFSFFTINSIAQSNKGKLIDHRATKETKALYKNLKKLSGKHILFGHQHATEYGHGWQGETDRSDVKSVTGSHPAVIGVDFAGLANSSLPDNVRQKTSSSLSKIVTDTYDRGGVTTVAWHFSNPASGGGFYWNDSISVAAVPLLIPGGSHHDKYKNILKMIADFANSAKGKNGKLAPMIFRPYHEFDGDWFWWGKGHSKKEDFFSLCRF